MIQKNRIFLTILIILLFSASVFAGDFSGSLTYSGQYSFTEYNLSTRYLVIIYSNALRRHIGKDDVILNDIIIYF